MTVSLERCYNFFMNKKILTIASIAVLLLSLSGCGGEKTQTKKEKFNIIIIAADTLRADHMHTFGYQYPTTPNLDRFAEKSFLYKHAFCPIPKTSASFASIMTGLHPFIHKTKPNRGYLKEKYLTLAEALKMQGYFNYAVVDNANLAKKFLFHQGFDEYIQVWNEIEEKEQSTPFITDKVLSFLDRQHDQPFFLWVNYIEAHTPYVPPKEYIEERPKGRDFSKVKPKIIAAMRRIIREKNIYDEGHYISLYDGAVKYLDAEMGKILEKFHQKGYDKNTILIFVGDHGEDLGEKNFYFNHGPLTFTAGTRIPLIMYMPGMKPRSINTPVSNMDIYPTLLKRLDLKPPYPIQGIDLLQPRKGRPLYMIGQVGSYAVVENNLHFIKVQPLMTKGLGIEANHLYRYETDPYETNNIYSQNTGLALNLDKKYQAYFQKHGYLKKGKNADKEDKLSAKEEKSLKTLGYL